MRDKLALQDYHFRYIWINIIIPSGTEVYLHVAIWWNYLLSVLKTNTRTHSSGRTRSKSDFKLPLNFSVFTLEGVFSLQNR